MNKRAFAGLFLLIVLGAAGLRLADLGLRPMHHDEANQALKFGALLEKGEYRYDRADHHGPSLYYLSLPFARALGADTLAGLSEKTLRLVPACFGIGAILLLLLFVPLLGKEAVLWGALGLALSPVMVYFSRFYIQETLLLFFLVGLIAALLGHRQNPSWPWALAAGFFAGMMYATKETSVIVFGSIAAASFLTRLLTRGEEEKESTQAKDGAEKHKQDLAAGRGKGKDNPAGRSRSGFRWAFLLVGMASAVLVSGLLFTSFFQNPGGWVDSILSFKVYFVRAGEAGFHVHPWHYYLQTLAFSKSGSGPAWSEGLILILAAAGIVAAFRRTSGAGADRSSLRFLVFYALISTAAYSLIPYKTPWNILPFYLGFILLAGSGAAALIKAFRSRVIRVIIFLLMAAGFLLFGEQAWSSSFRYSADPRNPYVYAQTSPGFLKLVRRVEDLAAVHPDRKKMLIKVIAGPYETWPLPWYFRRFDRVGYWTDGAGAGPLEDAPVAITDSEQAGRLESVFVQSFQSEYYELRPNVFLVLHVRADLWEEYLKSRAEK
jgi:uncharacterized protein (TIGR03663 family)